MRATVSCIKKLMMCAALVSVSACGNNFEDFNSWYGSAAYTSVSDTDMQAVKEEIARLRAQQQRYADIQTVPTRQTYQQTTPQQMQQPVQQAPQPTIRYERDERSDVNGGVNNGPLFPAMVNRNPNLAQAYRTAQAERNPSMWDGIWPSSAAQ